MLTTIAIWSIVRYDFPYLNYLEEENKVWTFGVFQKGELGLGKGEKSVKVPTKVNIKNNKAKI